MLHLAPVSDGKIFVQLTKKKFFCYKKMFKNVYTGEEREREKEKLRQNRESTLLRRFR
jgi:hypothetical protein